MLGSIESIMYTIHVFCFQVPLHLKWTPLLLKRRERTMVNMGKREDEKDLKSPDYSFLYHRHPVK
jgi:hypothetical protein